jgi:hypothetical protein
MNCTYFSFDTLPLDICYTLQNFLTPKCILNLRLLCKKTRNFPATSYRLVEFNYYINQGLKAFDLLESQMIEEVDFIYKYGLKIKKVYIPRCMEIIKTGTIKVDSNAVILACKTGRLQFLDLALEYNASKNSDTFESGYYEGLQAACTYGRLDIVHLLVKNTTVDVTMESNSCLRRAALNGHVDIVKYLLGEEVSKIQALRGFVNVDPSDMENDAIKNSVRHGYMNVVRILLQDSRVDPASMNQLCVKMANLYGNLDMLREYL